MIIGLTGPISSGKDTVAIYLKKYGFKHFSLSDELRSILKEKKIEPTRENLINWGNKLRKKYGTAYLAERILKKIKGNAVVSSIRNLGEIERLKKEKNFFLIGIDADPKIRFERAKKRNRLGDVKTFKEFLEKERKENNQKRYGQQLSLCLQKADYKIDNSKGLEELYGQVEQIFKEIAKKALLG